MILSSEKGRLPERLTKFLHHPGAHAPPTAPPTARLPSLAPHLSCKTHLCCALKGRQTLG